MAKLRKIFFREALAQIFGIYSMLKLLDTTGEYDCCVRIQGPRGVIEIMDLVWCPADRQDLLEIYYWQSWAVLQGSYHCCFSTPGKVSLLPPN